MKEYDINKVYTQKVAEYLQNGYTINPATMSGTQGEIAHIDLTNGTEVIRILLARSTDFEVGYDTVTLMVGRNTDQLIPRRAYDNFQTIWNGHLEVIEELKYYQLGDNYFVDDKEVAIAARRRSFSRWQNKDTSFGAKTEKLGDWAKEIAKRYLQRNGVAQRPRLDKIAVEKKTSYNHKERWYIVSYNGRQFRLA